MGHQPTVISAGQHSIERLAWCTGAGGDFLPQVASQGFRAYLTGEIAERHVHQARELGIHLIAAGHHATERYGVQQLGALLAETFQIKFSFIDEDVPV